jgi:Transglutaminase-like superfamily
MAPVLISAGAPGEASPGATTRSVSPGRDELIDALALLALTMIGVVGFRPAYGGHGYLIAGAAGVVVGLLLSHAGQRAKLPLITVVAASVLAFLLLGGVVSGTGTVSLPTLQTIMDAVVSGWQQLLTTARPVGKTAGLLALPYLLGLFSGVAGHALARRTRAVLLPAAAPAVVVALSILFGAPQPVDALLQGAGFAALALAWAAVRQERGAGRRTTIGRQQPWQRAGAGALVLAVAGAGAAVIGPHLPGAGAHKRVVLAVVPPFDVSQYPSPLAAFRDYTKDVPPSVSVYGKQLLATTGLTGGTLVRIAAMDHYDGLAWGVTNAAPVGPAPAGTFGGFQRVGAQLPGARPGPAETATITVEPAYDQPWLPDLAGTTAFGFASAAGAAANPSGCPASSGAPAASPSAAAALRYNVTTSTGIIPDGVPCGLTYTVSYAPPAAAPSPATLASDAPAGTPDPSIVIPPAVQAFAAAHSQAAGTPMGKVIALATYLKGNGRYSDGGGDQSQVTAGHSAGRLTTFLESSSKQIVGDGEQYAATMALLANQVGVPARVSLDGAVEPGGVVKGADVRADVELDTAEYGWVTLPAKDFTGDKAPTLQQQQVTPPQQPVKVVPPRRNQAAPVAAANESNAVARSSARPSSGPGFAIPAIVVTVAVDAGVPALAIAGLAGALAGAKALRRRRRRSFGSPATRVAGAWQELLDLSRDLGIEAHPAPGAGTGRGAPTRREFAARAESQGLPSALAVAAAADAAVFGPADPDGAVAKRIWDLVTAARRGATTPLPRWRRTWVAVNPASLRVSRAALGRAVSRARRAVPRAGGPGAARGPRPGYPVTGGAYQ